MNPFQRIANLSPLPIVDLTQLSVPHDGVFMKLSVDCRRHYNESDKCGRHYEFLASKIGPQGEPLQCPFGFASVAFRTQDVYAALTGFVPLPRLGGSQERTMARRHKALNIETEGVHRSIDALIESNKRFLAVEEDVLKGHSMALHEIRKLNRTVKQSAERLCRESSPDEPDKANPALVRIWKSAELMSNEFDVIEILANSNQATLPLNTTIEPYRIFDKCVKIYNAVTTGGRHLGLNAPYKYSPKIVACDKTFHIIISVFIENALKYSAPGTEIRIWLEPNSNAKLCAVTITSESEGHQILDDRVFARGYRASLYGDGSGNGLYVAQLIAKQHNTQITVQSSVVNPTRVRHTFRMDLKTVN